MAIKKNIKVALPSADIEDFMAQNTSFHISLEEALQSDKPVRYVVGSDGVYLVRSNNVGTFIAKTDSVSGACKVRNQVQLHMPHRVPHELFQQIVAFFMAVYSEHKSEAAAQIFWDEEHEEYFVYIPKQEVTGATCKYYNDQQLMDNYPLVVDIHSHGSMSAFFSSTDDKDDKDLRVYGVVGKVNTPTPEYKFRFGHGDGTKEIAIQEIFDMPYDHVSFPQEWLDQVTEKKVTVKYSPTKGLFNVDSDGYKKPKTTSIELTKDNNIELVKDPYDGMFLYASTDKNKELANEELIDKCLTDLDSAEVYDLVAKLMAGGHSDIIEDCVTAYAYMGGI